MAFYHTVLKFYDELSSRKKIVIAGAAVACCFAGCAIWYYRRECKENIRKKPTDEDLKALEEDKSAEKNSSSAVAVSDVKDLLEVSIRPDSIKASLPSQISGTTMSKNTHTVCGDHEIVVSEPAPRKCRKTDDLVNKTIGDGEEDRNGITVNEPQQIVLKNKWDTTVPEESVEEQQRSKVKIETEETIEEPRKGLPVQVSQYHSTTPEIGIDKKEVKTDSKTLISSFSNTCTEEMNLLVSDGCEASTMLVHEDFVISESSTIHVQSSTDSCEHTVNKDKTITAQGDSTDNTYKENLELQIKVYENSEAGEKLHKPKNEEEPLFIDTSSWRDNLYDKDINFVMCILSVEVGNTCENEVKVNLNRQKYRVALEREARAKFFYSKYKEATLEFSSETKVSSGGVKYGFLKFINILDYNEPYYYQPQKTSPTNKKEAQYIFLDDDDDVIDVTNNLELQRQFLSEMNLKDYDADEDYNEGKDDDEGNDDDDDDDDDEEGGEGGEDENQFSYLEEMMNEEEDTERLDSRHHNQIPNYCYQNYGQERSNSSAQSQSTYQPQVQSYNTLKQQANQCSRESNQSQSSAQHRQPPYNTSDQFGAPSYSTQSSYSAYYYSNYNSPSSHTHFQSPAGGYYPQTPTAQGSFYQQCNQCQFQQTAPGINTRQYNTHAPRHGDQWQQQGAQPFVQHGTTYFHDQTQAFVHPADAPQYRLF